MTTDPIPEKMPLTATTCRTSRVEIELVQLFSTPQQRQAATTSKDPGENESAPSSPSDSSRHDDTMAPMPAQRRGVIGSWNTASAISAVATISRLLRSDTLALRDRISLLQPLDTGR